MYGSPECSKHKFPSIHSKKFRIGQKLALKWTKTLADLHIYSSIRYPKTNQKWNFFMSVLIKVLQGEHNFYTIDMITGMFAL